jgi:four helix bundle protein
VVKVADKKQDIASFEDLLVWQVSRDLRKRISSLCEKLPKSETYRLKDQMLRASRSVTANIAEGYGRFHFQENIQYCRQARGSLYELIDHLSVGFDENYFDKSEVAQINKETIRTIKLINGYIGYLNKSKANKVKEPEIDYSINEPTNNEIND